MAEGSAALGMAQGEPGRGAGYISVEIIIHEMTLQRVEG